MQNIFARLKFIGKFEKFMEKMLTDGMVRRWCRMFSEGKTNVHDDRSGLPSLATADLLDEVNEIPENRRIATSELSTHFPHISRSLLNEIVTEHLQYHKLCARWVSKMLTDDRKTKRMGAALNFLVQYHNEGDKFLSHIVIEDETWISHVTPENMQRHSASPKQRNSIRRFPPGRSCVTCFETDVVFCSLTSWLK
jgi:hypothetical protein